MVKNEEAVIQQTLERFLDKVVGFLIFDTGSQDNTITHAQEFIDAHGITNGYIKQEPFVDFATSRNRALDLAEEKFPNADFIISVDAEWYLDNLEGLLKFCKEHKNDTSACYLVRLTSPGLDFYSTVLIRSHTKTLNHYTEQKVPADVCFQLNPTRHGIAKSVDRWVRDRDLLRAAYKKNPNNTRTLFYLAQTYACLGDWENACIFYKKRVQLSGWDEEDYIARYRLADAVEHAHQTNPNHTWSQAMACYLAAYEMRPHRAEPLVRIAHHYLQTDNHRMCYLFARRAVELPYPENDILFVENYLYDYLRYDILGRCAWYVGEFDVGEQAVRSALDYFPDAPHLHQNLACYIVRRNEF